MDSPYQARGTLTGRSYIERDADNELQSAIKDNDRYPYFLAPRQSGKSSVMERTKSLLASDDLRIVIIDLSLFSQKELDDFDQFELNFVAMVYKKLGVWEKLEINFNNLKQGPLFLLESMQLLLHSLTGRIIICIDELNVLLERDFKDDFLSQIRAIFNERASDPFLKRIQFILSAAVSRSALISDPNRSPFNVGSQIILRDFDRDQVQKLVEVGNWLETMDIERASDRIYYWTSGSAFLSQSILEKAYRRRYKMEAPQDICELIDDIVWEIIISAPQDVHFRNIRRQLEKQPSLLSKWKDWMDGMVPDMAVRERLLLAGISDEKRPIRNMIYRRIFSGGGTLDLIPEISRSFEYDVFLSYSPENKKTVHALAEQLKRDGLQVWLDSWVIQPGDSINLQIQNGLERSRNLVLCMSCAYFKSVWGTFERHTHLFRDLTNTRRRLIPLLIEDCTLPESLAQIVYIDLRTQSNEAYRTLLTACMPKEINGEKLAIPSGQADHGRLVMDIERRSNATDLDQWADRREAQATLPRLIRRLVLASVKKVERLHFRSDEGIQFGGWDGIIQAIEGNAFVPDGLSGWELSTSGDFRRMAENNYRKRSADPRGLDPASTSFIFVTTRRWPGKTGDEKENWAAEKRRQGIWRDVRVYDADDLDTWLEQVPAVDLWFSMLIGKQPVGIIDLSNFWDEWSRATDPPLSLDLVIAGRESNILKIHEWLRLKPSVLGLQADTWEEAIAYFMASLFQLPEEERERVLAKAIVVKDDTAWRQLALSDSSLILIPIFSDRSIVTTAVEKGHHVFFPMDRSEPIIGNTLALSRLRRTEAKKALEDMGINEESKVSALATLARRSIGALRRELAIFPNALVPEWAKQPETARSLLAVLLAGRWDDKNLADQEAVARLAGCKYTEVREILLSWSQKLDPPVRLVEHTWMVAARKDAWLLLARYLTDDFLERFGDLVLSVLGEVDPKFELPESERWMANIHGKIPKHSIYLRNGLTEALALMASLSDSCSLGTKPKSGQDWANGIVSGVFDQATDWKSWASLSPFLPPLAEAAPEIFLEAIERDLSATSPNLVHLFTGAENHIMQSSPHTGLLWALQRLAWSPEYLGQSALILAKLEKINPNEKSANRPIGSLRGIFLIWHPCTTAKLERRLRVLDTIRHREPSAAWDLMASILPRASDVAFPTSKPEYRNWLPEEEISVAFLEVLRSITETVSRLLEDARTDGTRWRTLIELLDDIPQTEFDSITNNLLTMDLEALPQPDRLQIWGALRDLLSRHLQFPDAKWVLPQAAIECIRQCYVRFEPKEPVLKRSWLFSRQCSFPDGGPSRGQERKFMINQARTKAVEELFDTGGLPMLYELADNVEDTYCLGWALAQSRVFDSHEALLLSQELGSTETAQRYTIRGLLKGRTVVNGQEWLEGLRSSELWNKWLPWQRADYYMCLPFAKPTWDALEIEESEVQRLYWLSINVGGDLEPKDCEYITSKLVEYGRVGTAVDFMALYRGKLLRSPQLVAEVLDRAIQGKDTAKVNWGSLAYEVGELLDLLEASNEIEEKQIAQLEWYFLPLLTNYGRPPKILHKSLAQNPEFFIDVLKLLYRAEGEEQGKTTEEQRIHAHLSFDLLQSWRQPPGINEDGSVSPEKLKSWIDRARELAHANGLDDVADHHIGQILVHYPNGADGAWPHEALRDLIEDLGNEKIEDGISIGIYNDRGVVSRSIGEGGAQEKAIAERYRSYAGILSDKWPRTARLMKKVAEIYASEAHWEDGKAELFEDLTS